MKKKLKPLASCLSILLLSMALAPGIAHADDEDQPLRIAVSRADDVDLSCDQLWKEAFLMRDIIAQTRETQSDSKLHTRGIGVVGTAASYLVGTVTGGLSIAAAGLLASEASKERSEDAEMLQESAQQRRAMVAGIFAAKGCEGPIQEAMQDPRPKPAMTAQQVAQIAPAAGEQQPTYNQ